MSPEIVSQAVTAYFAAIRAMDQQAWLNTFATDAISYDPVGAPAMIGHQKIGGVFSEYYRSLQRSWLNGRQGFHRRRWRGGEMDRKRYQPGW